MTINDLLSEDPIIANKRAALVAKRDRLQEIKRTLDEFPTIDPDDMTLDLEPLTPHAFGGPPLPESYEDRPSSPAFAPSEPPSKPDWKSMFDTGGSEDPISTTWGMTPVSPISPKAGKKKGRKGAM